ncbi:MAG: 50S ribosomal protein L44e [Candidatus Woesearchaeota archaeon]
MKLPKAIKRHCKHCNKHTEHKVSQAKNRGRSKANPLAKMGSSRVRERGERRGHGNFGKYSKPAIKSWKRTGKKQSKKSDLRYACSACKKQSVQKQGIRAKKLELI